VSGRDRPRDVHMPTDLVRPAFTEFCYGGLGAGNVCVEGGWRSPTYGGRVVSDLHFKDLFQWTYIPTK
jgi:hypothetical protein